MMPGDERDSGVGRTSARLGANEGGLKSALPPDGGAPGVPLFRTWRGGYWFVFGCFVAAVLALTIFSRVFA